VQTVVLSDARFVTSNKRSSPRETRAAFKTTAYSEEMLTD